MRSPATLHIEHLLDRKPAKLSGGERQRVALGRAIVRDPKAYLFDEPISALDALLRLEMRTELKRLQRDLGRTLVYVTHDQVEAMSMADRIADPARGSRAADRAARGHLPPPGEPFRRDRRRIAADELPPGHRLSLERHGHGRAPRLPRQRAGERAPSALDDGDAAGSASAPRTSTSSPRRHRRSGHAST